MELWICQDELGLPGHLVQAQSRSPNGSDREQKRLVLVSVCATFQQRYQATSASSQLRFNTFHSAFCPPTRRAKLGWMVQRIQFVLAGVQDHIAPNDMKGCQSLWRFASFSVINWTLWMATCLVGCPKVWFVDFYIPGCISSSTNSQRKRYIGTCGEYCAACNRCSNQVILTLCSLFFF